MKKSLVLAMAMALGVTASAYAANPFSDVPAGHWAYDSIDKLAAAGVIDGMGDGTYQGDKTMTRYEMAQIVAKAMAKGANVDKLAAEFADELDNLGVRVANLEKKADNVKITGAVSMHVNAGHAGGLLTDVAATYDENGDLVTAKQTSNHKYMLRTDLTLKGQVNEKWSYTALLRNEQRFDNSKAGVGEETDVRFQRAYVNGRIGGLAIQAGRYNKGMAQAEIWNNRVDGVEVSYGKAIKVTAGYAQLASAASGTAAYGSDAKVLYAEVKANLNKKIAVGADYYALKDIALPTAYNADGDKVPASTKFIKDDGDINIWDLNANIKLSKNLNANVIYLHSDMAATERDGWSVKMAYKGASAAKPGSYGLYAKYVNLPKSIQIENGGYSTPSFNPGVNAGFEGMIYGANYAIAKNIVGTVEFYDLSTKAAANNTDKQQTLYCNVAFTF